MADCSNQTKGTGEVLTTAIMKCLQFTKRCVNCTPQVCKSSQMHTLASHLYRGHLCIQHGAQTGLAPVAHAFLAYSPGQGALYSSRTTHSSSFPYKE